MKYALTTLLIIGLVATTAQAQNPYQQYQNMTPEQMQAMQEQMVKQAANMQDCFAKAGGAETMQRFQQKAEAGMAEIKQLCNAGKRQEAEKHAMAFGQRLQADSDAQALRKCGEAMDTIEILPPQLLNLGAASEAEGKHICD